MKIAALAFGLIAMCVAAASKGATIDACRLLSAEEVSAVAGVKVMSGDRKDSGLMADGSYSSTCVWKVAADSGEPADPMTPLGKRFAMLNAISWPAGSKGAADYVNSFREAAKSNLIDMTPVTVKAGDDALWWGDGVAVRKGDISFGVSVHIGVEKTAERSMEESLAKKIVPKL
jgi:hypothetical protein